MIFIKSNDKSVQTTEVAAHPIKDGLKNLYVKDKIIFHPK